MSSKREIDWPEVWRQIAEALEKHGASLEVRKELEQTEWEVKGDKFILYCPKSLYEWIEVPSEDSMESNLKYIKPILWPVIQRLGCRTMMYKFL